MRCDSRAVRQPAGCLREAGPPSARLWVLAVLMLSFVPLARAWSDIKQVRSGRRRARSAAEPCGGHDPERRFEGVHGAQHVHLPAGAVNARHKRHLRVHF